MYKPAVRVAFKIPNVLLSLFPMQNTIVMESNPDMACNTFELYRYIIANDEFPGFKIIWQVSHPEKFAAQYYPDRVSFIDIAPHGVIDRVKRYCICNRAKLLIDCNRHYRRFKTSKKQINIYLDHGMPLKNMINRYGVPLDFHCDYVISQAKFFNHHLKAQYGVSDEQIYVGGVPRNDQFFHPDLPLNRIYSDFYSFKKVIVWVPTFRKIKDGGRVDCISDLPLGFPILYSERDIILLEKQLAELNVLLIIKPHPVQDLTVLKALQCDHIRVLYNEEMMNCGVQTNELLKQCHAMITDYSGIYYDYLLTDRPIAITLDDYEAYKDQKGFVFEDALAILKGFRVYDMKDLISFIDSVVQEKDDYLNERIAVKKLTNDWIDGNSAKRVCEFIKQKYSEKWQ